MTTTETTTAPATAVRFYRGKRCVVRITTPDGTTHELAGKRAERAAAAVIYRLGERTEAAHAETLFGYSVTAGWHIEGLRQTIYAAHTRAAAIARQTGPWGYYGRHVLEATTVFVHDAEA
jgi:hypothetical protein